MCIDRVAWKDKLSDEQLQEELALAFAKCFNGRTTPVINSIYKRFPECQRHTNNPKEDKKQDRQDIISLCRPFNTHSQQFNAKQFLPVIQNYLQRELQAHSNILFPALKSTITGIWDDIERINTAKKPDSFENYSELTKARNESIESQSKVLDHAIRINQLIVPAKSGSTTDAGCIQPSDPSTLESDDESGSGRRSTRADDE